MSSSSPADRQHQGSRAASTAAPAPPRYRACTCTDRCQQASMGPPRAVPACPRRTAVTLAVSRITSPLEGEAPNDRCPVRSSALGRYGQGGEALVGVSQPDKVDGKAGKQQGFDRLTGIPDIRVHGGPHPAVPDPEGNEFPSGRVPSENDLIPNRGPPAVLHSEVVLVGEEVRQPVVSGGVPENVLGRHGTLVEGRRPVLEANTGAVARMEGIGHVAGGKDTRRAGGQMLIH